METYKKVAITVFSIFAFLMIIFGIIIVNEGDASGSLLFLFAALIIGVIIYVLKSEKKTSSISIDPKSILYVIIGIVIVIFCGIMIFTGLANEGGLLIAVIGGIIIAAIVSSTKDSYKDQQEGIIRLNSQADFRKKVEMETAILAKHGYKRTPAYYAEMAELEKRYQYGPRQK